MKVKIVGSFLMSNPSKFDSYSVCPDPWRCRVNRLLRRHGCIEACPELRRKRFERNGCVRNGSIRCFASLTTNGVVKNLIPRNLLWVGLLFCFVGTLLGADIDMRLTSMDGESLSQAGAGEPFLIEITVKDSDSTQSPNVRGIDSLNIRNAGIQIRSINGKSTVKHRLKARIDSPGVYTIGPATIVIDGEQLTSEVLTVYVGDRQLAKQPRPKKRQEQSAYVTLKLNKKEIFLGEKIVATLQFLYSDNTVSLETITEPECEGFSVGKKSGPEVDIRTIDGKEYNVLIWRFELYPTKTGTLTIPAYSADFLIQTRRDRFAGLSLFFGPQATRKRVYSNAAQIKVLPLPPHDPPVEAIGSFVGFSARLDPPVAKEGEGMVFSLCLEGEGNLDAIKTPELQGIPHAFKWYDSKNYKIEETTSGKPSQCFEYIIQGLEGGEWEIPPQEFTYFDTKRQTFKTLKTAAINVSVISQLNTKKFKTQRQQEENSADQVNQKQIDNLLPLNKNGAWYKLDNRSMSWYLFLILIVLSLSYGVFSAIAYLRSFIHDRYAVSLRKNRAFAVARKQLERIESTHDIVQLYQLFVDLFSSRLQVSTQSISQSKIEEILRKAGWNDEKISRWNAFFIKLTEQVYTGNTLSTVDRELLEQADQWLRLLEKVI